MTLEFINNGAALKGGAVFINTLTSCLWTEYPPHNSFEKALRWNDKFVYRGNYVDALFNIIDVDYHHGKKTDVANSTIAQRSFDMKKIDVDIATDTSTLHLNASSQVCR